MSSVTLVGSSNSDSNEIDTTSSPHHSPKKSTSTKKEHSPTKESSKLTEPLRVEPYHRPIIKHDAPEKKVERGVSEDTEGTYFFQMFNFLIKNQRYGFIF